MRDKILFPLKKKIKKRCQIDLFESGVKHCGVKTNTVLSSMYKRKESLMIYRYVHLPLPANLSANIISVNPKTSYVATKLYKSHLCWKILGRRMSAAKGLLYCREQSVIVSKVNKYQ